MASKLEPDPTEIVDANGVSLAEALPAPEPEPVDETPSPDPAVPGDEPVPLVHPDSSQVIYADPAHVPTYTDAGWYLQPADKNPPAPDEPAEPDESTTGETSPEDQTDNHEEA